MSAGSTEVTDPSAFQYRSLGMQVLFSVVTFLIYWLYWIHVTHKQLANGTDAEFSPAMRTIGLFIPIYNFLVMWRTCSDCEAVTDHDGPILFLFWLVFVPVFWYLVQSGINDVAQGS